MMSTKKAARMRVAAAGAAIGVLVLAGCAVDDGGSGEGSETGEAITIGLITSTTGPLADAGNSFVNGFEGGLDYLTDGTGIIDGHKVNVEIRNDNGDAATGLAAAKELLGNGARLIVGPASSAVAVPVAETTIQNGATYIAGPSGTTELLGKDKSIFVSGPGGWMANQALVDSLGDDDKTVLYLGQDYAFGIDSANTIEASASKRGITTERLLLPSDTQDFTAAAAQVAQMAPDALIVAWPGTGAAQLYAALADQGIFDQMRVTTGIAYRNSIPGFVEAAGDNLADVYVICTYYEGFGGGNELEQAMIDYAGTTDTMVDYVHPQGFTAAQMVVRAIQEAGAELDQDAVSAALTGWTFDTPIGEATIREQDHLLTVPSWEALAVQGGDGEYVLDATRTLTGEDLTAGLDASGILHSFDG